MKIRQIVAAAALAVVGAQAFAVTQGESFDTLSSTYFFGASQIGAANTSFTFTLDAADGLAAGAYAVSGDLSGTNFAFSGATLNGAAWDLYADNKGMLRFGSVEAVATGPIVLEFTGVKIGAGVGNGNFQGSLVLTPVPEPETYALMLGGLAAVGFMMRRRRQD
jgi:hypothetical protein